MSDSFAHKSAPPVSEQTFRILVSKAQCFAPWPPFVCHDVMWTSCGLNIECLSNADSEIPDLVLLETKGSVAGALQLCRSLRSEAATNSMRIAIWGAGMERSRRLEFFRAGADHVATDALIGSDNVMRLTVDARRSLFGKSHVTFADLVLFPDRYLAWRRGKSITLSQFQVELLQFLMENPKTVFSRDDLSEGVWKGRPVHDRSISTAVRRLKRLLNLSGVPDLIHTVRGGGYVFQTK